MCGVGADAHHPSIVGLGRPLHHTGPAELFAHFFDDQRRGALHRPQQHRAKEERQRPADEQADEHQRVGDVEPLAQKARRLDVRPKQAHGGDDGRGDGDAFGDGLGGVADRVQHSQGFLAFWAGELFLAYLGDPLGVVRDGAKGVHGQVVAGMGEHPNAGHGHRVQDEQHFVAGRGVLETADD